MLHLQVVSSLEKMNKLQKVQCPLALDVQGPLKVTRKRGNDVYHASTQNLLSSAKTVSGSQLVRKVAQHIADVMVGAVRIELGPIGEPVNEHTLHVNW